jgi:hypothetical protein
MLDTPFSAVDEDQVGAVTGVRIVTVTWSWKGKACSTNCQ